MIGRKLFFITISTIVSFVSFSTIKAFVVEGSSKDAISGNLNRAVYPELSRFIEMYRCSDEFENHKSEHFAKGGQIDRLINAKRAERVIAQKNLTSLRVPHKCLSKKADGSYEVLSEGLRYPGLVERFENRAVSLSEVRQIVDFAQATGYTDWHGGNVIRTLDNQIGICDTEDRSFMMVGDVCTKTALLSAIRRLLLGGTDEQDKRCYSFTVDAEGSDFLKQLLEDSKQRDSIIWSLKANTVYDDKEIDFEKVKRELAHYRERSSIFKACYWSKKHCSIKD